MHTKQAQVSDYQSQNLSLANQTVDLLDRLDRRKELPFDPLKSVQKSSMPLVRRVLRPTLDKVSEETSFAPPADGNVEKVANAAAGTTLSITVSDEFVFDREILFARKAAIKNVEPWRAESELKFAQNSKRAAEGGRYLDEETRIRTIEIADTRLVKAQIASDAAGPTKYAQTVRSLRDYAVAISKHVINLSDATERDKTARYLATDLETMVRSVKNLEKGSSGDLPQINLKESFDCLARLVQVRDHLEEKISRINSNQDKRLDRLVEQNSILTQLQNRLHELPSDGVIFFFNRDGLIIKAPMSKPGNILVGVDRLEYPKSKLRPDGTFLNQNGESVKVEMTYKAIDVPRWKNAGNGPNGAGIDRFAGDDIAGAAIVRPKAGAKPIQANKRVFVEKEVVGMIGHLPSDVIEGMPFKELAKRFGNMEFCKKSVEHKSA